MLRDAQPAEVTKLHYRRRDKSLGVYHCAAGDVVSGLFKGINLTSVGKTLEKN